MLVIDPDSPRLATPLTRLAADQNSHGASPRQAQFVILMAQISCYIALASPNTSLFFLLPV